MRIVSFALATVLCCSGCQTYAPVRVTLINGATGRPIAGAPVSAQYSDFMTPLDIRPRFTDAQGTAIVPVAIDPKGWSTPYQGLWIGGNKEEADEAGYASDDPDGEQLIAVPSVQQLRAAWNAAGHDARRIAPIPVTLRVRPLPEWRAKYRNLH